MSDYWGWANSPLMTMNTWGQPQAPGGSDSDYAQQAAEAAAARMRRMGGGQGYRGNWTPDQQDQYGQRLATGGEMAGSVFAPWATAAIQAGSGDYADAGMTAGLPYVGRFLKPFLKPAAAAGAAGVGLGMGGSTTDADAAQKTAASGFPEPPSDMTPSERTSYLAAQHTPTKGAVDGVMAKYNERIQNQNAAAREKADFGTYMDGIQKDPEFVKLPQRLKSNITQTRTMDDANKAFSAAKAEVTPFGEKYKDAVTGLEAAGIATGAYMPIRGARTLARSVNRAEGAYGAAVAKPGNEALQAMSDMRNEQLRSAINNRPTNFMTEHALPVLGHGTIGAVAPFVGGTVVPNFVDTMTLPHDSEGYKHAAGMFDVTNPETQAAAKRSGIEGALTGLVGHGIGHTAAAGATDRGLGLLNSIDKRAAAMAEPAKAAVDVPGALSRSSIPWSTPEVQELYGAARNASLRRNGMPVPAPKLSIAKKKKLNGSAQLNAD